MLLRRGGQNRSNTEVRHLVHEEETKVDQLKGKWLQFKGEVKKQWGKLINDELKQIEGNYEKVIGMLQQRYGANCVHLVRERYGGEKHELIQWVGRWLQRSQPEVAKEKTCLMGESSNRESWIGDKFTFQLRRRS